MRDLHAELTALEVEWPETPDIAATVAVNVPKTRATKGSMGRSPRRRRVRLFARPVLVFAAALLLLAGTAIALDVFNLRGATVKRGPVTASPTPRSGLGDDLGLGRPISNDRVPVPSLGRPDATYLDESVPGPRTSYVYRERAGVPRTTETGVALLITVLRGTFTPAIEKTAGQGVEVERFEVDGQPAVRLSGEAHGYAYVGENGDFHFEQQRLAATTLLVERGDLLIRIEGRLGKARAVGIAREIRVPR